jgi:hypothetical protein
MNAKPSKDTIEEVALLMSIEPAYVEKDWFITHIIALLTEAKYGDFELIFTGGTALSKAHNLIKRYSEDIDYRILSPKHLQTRSSLSKFKNYIVHYLNEKGFNISSNKVHAQNNNQHLTIEIDYETYFDKHIALRPHIQIEMSVKTSKLPHINKPISSFINQLAKQPPEAATVSCSDPLENAADKLSAITWRIPERIRGAMYDDPSIVRHIYDLAILYEVAMDNIDFASLVTRSLQEDINRPRSNPAFESLPLEVKFAQMIKILENDPKYPKEYQHFIQSMSYAPNDSIPSYESSLFAIKKLIDKVVTTDDSL